MPTDCSMKAGSNGYSTNDFAASLTHLWLAHSHLYELAPQFSFITGTPGYNVNEFVHCLYNVRAFLPSIHNQMDRRLPYIRVLLAITNDREVLLSDMQCIVVGEHALIYRPSVCPANERAFMHMCARAGAANRARGCVTRAPKSCATRCGRGGRYLPWVNSEIAAAAIPIRGFRCSSSPLHQSR